jgi:hypothetical protein
MNLEELGMTENQLTEQDFAVIEDAPQQENQDRVDWKAEAIRAQTRLESMREMQQSNTQTQQAATTVSETQQLEQQIQEMRSKLPPIDPTNPNAFWEREQQKERLDDLRFQLSEARERERRNAMMSFTYQQQAQTLVQKVKQQFSGRPAFAKVERTFDEMVNRLAPNVRADPNALMVMMKTLLFDAGDGGGPKQPPSAPNAGYSPARAGGQRRGQQVEFRSQEEAEVASYYGMTAEEYYDPRFNERAPDANGVNIYPFEIGRRR